MSNDPMVAMSRAIRHTIEDFTPLNGDRTLGTLPDAALQQFAEIVAAFNADLRDELARRRAQAEATT